MQSSFRAISLAFALAGTLVLCGGCSQGEGDRCEIPSDCASGLVCRYSTDSPHNGICSPISSPGSGGSTGQDAAGGSAGPAADAAGDGPVAAEDAGADGPVVALDSAGDAPAVAADLAASVEAAVAAPTCSRRTARRLARRLHPTRKPRTACHRPTEIGLQGTGCGLLQFRRGIAEQDPGVADVVPRVADKDEKPLSYLGVAIC